MTHISTSCDATGIEIHAFQNVILECFLVQEISTFLPIRSAEQQYADEKISQSFLLYHLPPISSFSFSFLLTFLLFLLFPFLLFIPFLHRLIFLFSPSPLSSISFSAARGAFS